MVKVGRIVPCRALMLACAGLGEAVEPERWWLQPQRMLQTNLREPLNRWLTEPGETSGLPAT